MKNICIIFLWINLLIIPHATAQWHDANWMMGLADNYISNQPWPYPNQCLIQLNFKNNNEYPSDSIIRKKNECNFGCATNCISDYDGNLLFYTDGRRIFDRTHKIAINGDTINPGFLWPRFEQSGYPIDNSVLFLPQPSVNNAYYLFHKRYVLGQRNNRFIAQYVDQLFYSKIEINNTYPDGIVTEKNKTCFESVLADSELSVVRHGNGRDYWIVTKESVMPIYHFVLLDKTGPHYHHNQTIGISHTNEDLVGSATFSSDGHYFARIQPKDGIELFEFDRCAGSFSNPKFVQFEDSLAKKVSVEFSPSGEFLYVNSPTKIWQYEVAQFGIDTAIQVAQWNGLKIFNWYTFFYQARLAANGKIYYSNYSGFTLTTIHEPDKKGIMCDVRQHDLILSSIMESGLPFFPNYRLGALQGSICDSLSTAIIEQKEGKYYLDNYNILRSRNTNTTQENLQLSLLTMDGKMIWKKDIHFNDAYPLNVIQLVAGVYFLQIRGSHGLDQLIKFVKT